MSLNAALNATVALIEGRTDIAKDILRAPSSDVKDVPGIMARLNRSVDRAAAKAMRNALVASLTVQPAGKIVHDKVRADCPKCGEDFTVETSHEEAFFQGVSAVETIIEQAIERLEQS
jgi:hypothetical protein